MFPTKRAARSEETGGRPHGFLHTTHETIGIHRAAHKLARARSIHPGSPPDRHCRPAVVIRCFGAQSSKMSVRGGPNMFNWKGDRCFRETGSPRELHAPEGA